MGIATAIAFGVAWLVLALALILLDNLPNTAAWQRFAPILKACKYGAFGVVVFTSLITVGREIVDNWSTGIAPSVAPVTNFISDKWAVLRAWSQPIDAWFERRTFTDFMLLMLYILLWQIAKILDLCHSKLATISHDLWRRSRHRSDWD